MQDSAASDLHHYKYVENAEADSHSNRKIAGHDRLAMVPHEGHPALRGMASIGTEILWPIGPHGPRRYLDAQLERQFRGNPGFTPSRILPHHLRDKCTEGFRYLRPTASRFPTPKDLECSLMPTNECFRLNDHKSIPPVEPL